jgi:hypothetical protein
MDETRFDALTRSLTSGTTRRGLGRLLGSLTLGGVLATWLSPAETQAKKKNNDNDKKKSCPSCKKKKDGKCKANKPDGTACENGGQCQSGSCVPSSGSSDVAPSPPPQTPYCAGKNTCAPGGASAACQTAGKAACYCYVRWDNGESYCSTVPNRYVTTCAGCGGNEVCVVLGGACVAGFACVTPCLNPR